MPHHVLVRTVVAVVIAWHVTTTALAAPSFVLTFDETIHAKPFSGRVYVFFSKGNREPRLGPDWFHPEPFIAKDVENWMPGEPLALRPSDESLLSYPKPLSQLDLAGYKAQPVARFSPREREVGSGPGNGYGPPSRSSRTTARSRCPSRNSWRHDPTKRRSGASSSKFDPSG